MNSALVLKIPLAAAALVIALLVPRAAEAQCAQIVNDNGWAGDYVWGATTIAFDPGGYDWELGECWQHEYFGGTAYYVAETVIEGPNGGGAGYDAGPWWAAAYREVPIWQGGYGGWYGVSGWGSEELCDIEWCYGREYVAGIEWVWAPGPDLHLEASDYTPQMNTGPVQVSASIPWWADPWHIGWSGCAPDPGNNTVCWVDTSTVGHRHVAAWIANGGSDELVIDVQPEDPPPPPPPPTVSVTEADIVNDRITVSLSPQGLSGTLTVRVGGTQVFSANRSGGTHSFSFDRDNLPVGEYTSVSADWSTPNGSPGDSSEVAFKVLGRYRHSQYNTPDEQSCSGERTSAVTIYSAGAPSCPVSTGFFKEIFRQEVLENGSGFSIQFGPVQREWTCASVGQERFRGPTTISGSHGPVNASTVAMRRTRGDGVQFNKQILIVGVGVKTVTDTCPDCSEHQFDNYTENRACRNNAFGDLGTFQTILLR